MGLISHPGGKHSSLDITGLLRGDGDIRRIDFPSGWEIFLVCGNWCLYKMGLISHLGGKHSCLVVTGLLRGDGDIRGIDFPPRWEIFLVCGNRCLYKVGLISHPGGKPFWVRAFEYDTSYEIGLT